MKKGNIITCIESFGDVIKGQVYMISQDSEEWEEAVWIIDNTDNENVYSSKLFKKKITFYT